MKTEINVQQEVEVQTTPEDENNNREDDDRQ